MSSQLAPAVGANEAPELDLAAEALFRFLSAALSDPRGDAWRLVLDPNNLRMAVLAVETLRDEFADHSLPLGFGELPIEDLDLRGVIAGLAQTPTEIRAEYERVFGLVTCRECPPYETEYHKNEDTFFRAQEMADIAGFYHAFGVEPGAIARERADFLPLELEFLGFLQMKKRLARAADQAVAAEQAEVCQLAYSKFFADHIAWWVPSFCLALRRQADQGLYAALGQVLAALLPIERTRLGIAPPMMPLEARTSEAPEDCDGCVPDDLVELKAP
jgi:TorA maturation chaperone TorD